MKHTELEIGTTIKEHVLTCKCGIRFILTAVHKTTRPYDEIIYTYLPQVNARFCPYCGEQQNTTGE